MDFVVVSTLIPHLVADIRKGEEPMLVQALRLEAAIENFNIGVIRRLA